MARGRPSRHVSPQEGIKKAGGPIWPTAQSLVLAVYRLALTPSGRKSPARGKAAAVGGGASLGAVSEIAHETPRDKLPIWQTYGML